MPILAEWKTQDLNMFHIAQRRRTWKAENFSFQIFSPSGPRIWTQCSISLSGYVFQEKKDRFFTNRCVRIPGVEVEFAPVTYSVPSRVGDLWALQLPGKHDVWENLNNVTEWDWKSEVSCSVITDWSLQEAPGVESHGLRKEFQALQRAQARIKRINSIDMVNWNKGGNGVRGQKTVCVTPNIPLQQRTEFFPKCFLRLAHQMQKEIISERMEEESDLVEAMFPG